ncbi:hypothetical protein ACWCRD_11320 [Streptomyces sp. NPDC002092]
MMLAQLPLGWLILMAAFATFLLCLAVDRWMRPPRKGTVVFLAASVVCCLGMVLVGSLQPEHWNARQMLVLYSFSWTGLAMGLFPSRKLFRTVREELDRGVRREKYEYPARYRWAVLVSVIGMIFLAFFLAK